MTLEDEVIVDDEQPEAVGGTPTASANGGGLLTQEQVNKLVGETRTAARETAVKGLLGELGVDSVDSLKKRLEAQKAAEMAQLSEVERLQAQLAEAQAQMGKLAGIEQAFMTAQGVIEKQVQAQQKRLNVPPHVTKLLSTLSPVEQLDYLAEYAEAFAKPSVPPDLNGNSRGKGKSTADEATIRAKYGI